MALPKSKTFREAYKKAKALVARRPVQEQRELTGNKLRAVEQLKVWMESHTNEFNTFIWRLISALPGGDRAEDLGFRPIAPIGWKEAQIISDYLEAMDSNSDVDASISVILDEEEEEF